MVKTSRLIRINEINLSLTFTQRSPQGSTFLSNYMELLTYRSYYSKHHVIFPAHLAN